MKPRERKRRDKRKPAPNRTPVPQPGQSPGPFRRLLLAGIALCLVAGVAVALWWSGLVPFGPAPSHRPEQASSAEPINTREEPDDHPEPARAENPSEENHRAESSVAKRGGSLLESFGPRKSDGDHKETGPVLSGAALEKQFRDLVDIRDRISLLNDRAAAGRLDPEELKQATGEKKRLVERFNRGSLALEKDLARARQARPGDAVPEWLTGELLCAVGGEPAEILPHLERAAARGLDRPRLLATLARVRFEANRFDLAYQAAAQALDRAGRDRYAWDAFVRAGFGVERFADVRRRLDRAFPQEKPAWAAEMRDEARRMQTLWQAEQKLRAAEKKADDLPRVRLVIEHRRFAPSGKGSPVTKIESTGREEVVIELFEDQAPATVANFLHLVERGFYDGTRFHLAQAATAVAGGDPNSKNADPSEDGKGGPGYVIPDEFAAKGARNHFRGSVSMFNTGPHTAGSRFFIALVPQPALNGRFTVFGRVIKGQGAVDRITQGRTHRDLGSFGPIIPGDLLVRAEVIRKRPHEYKVVEEMP